MSSDQLSKKSSPKHIVCFVALPFEDEEFAYKTVLLPAIRSIFEQHPYYWQVVRADDTIFASTIAENVGDWMQLADVSIADISNLNANVMMELGYMYWRKPKRPLFLLEREGTGKHLSDLAGVIRLSYKNVQYLDEPLSKKHAVDDLAAELKAIFTRRQDIKNLKPTTRQHYLSSLTLVNKCGIGISLASDLAQEYVTMENLQATTDADMQRSFPDTNLITLVMIRNCVNELMKALSSN